MSKPPDYHLHARMGTSARDATGRTQRVGAAWRKTLRDGREMISISLDPFVVLDGSKDFALTLFPNDREEE